MPADDPIRALTDVQLERLVESWADRRAAPVSDHLRLELATVIHRGRPLADDAVVPGCGCPMCTHVAADDPARRRPRRVRRPALDVDAARAVPVAKVARMLGLGEPRKAGRELVVRCPLHEDSDPSLRIDPRKGVWYCDPCAEGGDAIALLMCAGRLSFVEAVRELVGP